MELKLLGPPLVRWGREVFAPGPKAAALLAYLAIEGVASRERVLGQLWPESTQKKAQGSLRYLLHSIRKSAESLVQSDQSSLSLSPEAQVDISVLQTADSAKQRAAAAQLRRGPFCEGLNGMTPEFDDWLEQQREHWERTSIENLLQLANLLPPAEALKPARQALLIEPSNESAHALVVKLLLSQGEVAEAHRQMERCRQNLMDELGVEPQADTLALLEDRHLQGPENNLPLQIVKLIGREDNLSAVSQSLKTHRLVTLTGEGGIGKTTLALSLAHQVQTKDGVWMVELARLCEPAKVEKEIASACLVRDGLSLTEHFAEKSAILILDNCEHLLDASADIAHKLLTHCPNLRILATSREPLKIPTEQVLPLDPLELPRPGSSKAENSPSVQLFFERAAEVGATLDRSKDFGVVGEICRRLDGLPLAIELAAARTRGLTLKKLLEGLDQRFRILKNSKRTAQTRQLTLEALIDWSYDRLEQDDQNNFRALSVFRSGFYLESASQLLGLEEWDAADALELLVEKSLLRTQAQGQGLRYYFLESLREFGWQKLEEKSELKAVRERHLDYFIQLAHSLCPMTRGERQRLFLDQLDSERHNFRAALDFALKTDPSKALELAADLCPLWKDRDHRDEGRCYLEQALALALPEDPERARGLMLQGELEIQQGCCSEAIVTLTQSLQMGRDSDELRVVSRSAKGLGSAHFFLKDFEVSKAWFTEALQGFEELSDLSETANCINNLGMVELYLGQLKQAEEYFRRSEELHQSKSDFIGIGVAVGNRAYVAEAQGDLETSARLFRQALQQLNKVGALWNSAYFLEGFGKTSARLGETTLAINALAVAQALRERLQTPRLPVETESYTKVIDSLRSEAGEQFHQVWVDASALSPRDFIETLGVYGTLHS